ncbi:putative aminodeoxychorismate synthase-like protein [Hapsidospora chrysogenum ATCC 11550]|uniref:aminodeoxychorismate synthase n=1 Tax=Hapsidospora chrysogenum (strain ATCC 11550 / CBS 779.69 / DSM 880 / IAM 14645 / JCM 23072 / IMI 49137) TaxID=857340 RepID=A0A086T8D5_HAPC1|nr:putative aminodeoxychorismate synthase-like protein [Hapsidospora chrysogenum ATCC 11550]
MGSLDPELTERRRILFIDAFDSFTNNIVGLLERCLGADVTVVHVNDKEVSSNFTSVVDQFDAVVVGPGPGHPANPADVGFIDKLWRLEEEHLLPVLGICLGFQSLCYFEGAEVQKLVRARHGIVSPVTHQGTDIFAGIGPLAAVQYHSLRAVVSDDSSGKIFWEPSESCPNLRPLAWDIHDETNGPILMGVRHEKRPSWGVQFHPESICTSGEGEKLLEHWWAHAQEWLYSRGRRAAERGGVKIPKTTALPNFSAPDISDDDHSVKAGFENDRSGSHLAKELRAIAGDKDVFLRWGRHPASNITPTRLIEALGQSRDEVVVLDSQGHASGRYSILGLVVPGKTMKVTYRVTNRTLRYGVGPGRMSAMQLGSIEEAWPILQEALDLHDPRNQDSSSRASTPGEDLSLTGMDCYVAGHLPQDCPFWGGFMGYISYEAGLESIDVDLHPSCATGGVPDINFAFIHRSIVIDHQENQVYIQSLLPGDWSWILNAGRIVDELTSQAELMGASNTPAPKPQTAGQLRMAQSSSDRERMALDRALTSAHINRPTEAEYRAKVLRCQDFLATGDSYELCLTDETEISVPHSDGENGLDEWALYKRLRQNNPAPFGAFVRLSGVVVVGSSPERFLRWTRDGRCQFRPIKGTVKKGPDMTRERAHEILGSSKERAENLMIVDLIRHDLSGVIGAHRTWVSKLMVVEEYETVYQLVSVIEGQLPDAGPDVPRGLHVLKASLPPGSMTGAPKKRSCEILRDIEKRPRGLYSGVLGYMDVGGAGDFSVVIRTAMRAGGPPHACEPTKENGTATDGRSGDEDTRQREVWRVGAGGAVTIQSTDEGEFQEMEAKQSSVLSSLLKPKGH